MTSYLLENKNEGKRLESQSTDHEVFNYKAELEDFDLKKSKNFLDAGCGSGIVSRYVANQYPGLQVTGLDYSQQRLQEAIELAKSIPNIRFEQKNLSTESLQKEKYDSMICRYVLAHFGKNSVKQAIRNLYQALSPEGKIRIIDFDGIFWNLEPLTEFTKSVLRQVQNSDLCDLWIGRKLPLMLAQAGFEDITCDLRRYQIPRSQTETEILLTEQRLESFKGGLLKILGDSTQVTRFCSEYIECMRNQNSQIFYRKFIVSARKNSSTQAGKVIPIFRKKTFH